MKYALPIALRSAIILLIASAILTLVSCGDDGPPAPMCDGTLELSVVSVVDSECGVPQGSITVDATGGNPAYEYSINQGAFQSSGAFTDLIPGQYTIKVRDLDACETVMNVNVNSGVVIADIRPIISTNCAVPECHDGSSSLPNFTMDAVLRQNADLIKGRTGNRSMPPPEANTTLTTEEILRIACWANDGAN